MGRWPDRIVVAGIIFLIGFSALAFGAVHRAAFILVEAAIFALTIVWIAKLRRVGPSAAGRRDRRREIRRVAVPAIALLGLFTAQLAPLPPPLLRVIAPATYQLYRVAFPGWPALSPNQGLTRVWPTAEPGYVRALSPGGGTRPPSSGLISRRGVTSWRWRSIAIATGVAASNALEWTALCALSFLIVLYPFGLAGESEAEARFYRVVVVGCLTIGTCVALIGLAERAWWNGKLLWCYVPMDWGVPLAQTAPRASGPFVDPDHFANYLAMVTPLAAVAALFPLKIFPRARRSDVQMLGALGGLVMAAGLLFSLSRGGWIAAIAGIVIALGLCFRQAWSLAPALLRKLGPRATRVVALGFALGLSTLILVAGPTTRSAAATRLGTAIAAGDDVRYRPAVWRDTLGIIADYPLLGVGLGGWPELYPHYQRPPWMPFFFREAENDYLQLAAETGLAGIALMLWLGVAVVDAIRRGAVRLTEREWPLLAGLSGGIVAMIVHAGFDFSLHTPANALLLVVLIALALRMTLADHRSTDAARLRQASRASRFFHLGTGLGLIAASGLIVAAFAQDGAGYPYSITSRRGFAQAAVNVMAHPAMAAAHLALVESMGQRAPVGLRRAELSGAVWLNPNDPAARDQYAQNLLLAGNKAQALHEISESVFRAPSLAAHYYLAAPLIPWLMPDEQTAAASGFAQAVDQHFPGALTEMALFYGDLGRYEEIASLYKKAAQGETDPKQRLDFLILAGKNYGLARETTAAVSSLRATVSLNSTDARPYAELARSVYGPNHQMGAANSVVQEGMRNGANPFELQVALADAAEAAGDRESEENALAQALRYHTPIETVMRLGNLYFAGHQFDRAIEVFTQATMLSPDSGAAWFALGESNEGSYDYVSASRDYARACRIEPTNRAYAQALADFTRRVAQQDLKPGNNPDEIALPQGGAP
jgi:tetratricopeptide (TPR) repeat protein